MNNGDTVRLVTVAPKEEFWQSVVGSAWDSHPWWGSGVSEKEYENPYTRLTVKAWRPDRDGGPHDFVRVVTVESLVEAYSTAVTKGYRDACTGKPLQWDNLDACGSDVVLQLAVYGRVIFS